MEFKVLLHSLVLKLSTCGHSVMVIKVWNTLMLTNKRIAQPGTSQIKCNKLQVRFTLGITQADSDSLSVKHAFADSEKVSRLLEPVKSSKSCFFGHRLTSNFHNVNYNSNEFYMYWREYSLWNQADREKILGQSGLGACESARSLEALPPRLRRF